MSQNIIYNISQNHLFDMWQIDSWINAESADMEIGLVNMWDYI